MSSQARRQCIVAASLLLKLVVRCAAQDVFSEEALTTWLTPQHLLVHLRFDQATTASRLHTSFPHTVQHLASTLPLHVVELALTSGRWDYAQWGWPLVPVRPVGAVLDATFRSGLDERVLTNHWSALVHALSGLSCASLSLLRQPGSVSGGRIQVHDLAEAANSGAGSGTAAAAVAGNASAECSEGSRSFGCGADQRVEAGQRLHALLPREALCTENLTPWLRLLPCRDQAGLASLLRHRPTVFGADYVSLGLLLDRGVTSEGRPGIRFVQTFTFVVRLESPPPVPRQPPDLDLDQDRDIEQALGARVGHFCPAALRSQLYIAEPGSPGASGLGGTCPSPPGDASGAWCRWTEAGQEQRGSVGGASGRAQAWNEGEEGSGNGGGAQALQHGALLVPLVLSGGSTPDVAGLSRALPRLRMYDTLELLEASEGRGLKLSLPPAPPPQPRGAAPGSRGGAVDRVQPAGGTSHLIVDRFTTGAGLLRGGMVLSVRRSEELRARLAADAACGDSQAGAAADADVRPKLCWSHVICVHQVFPWYVRPWMHTLSLLYDGQVEPLRSHLVARHVRPAVQRTSPGVLDLCLHVPAHVAELQLRFAFSKAFLTVFEYPPDAHRGFDVPAAVISYADPLYGPDVQWRSWRSPGPEPGSAPGVGDAAGSPLLNTLALEPVQQVYAPGLLVPLAAPDFSMPYNVICLSSTVLAVYFGATLNLLTVRRRDTGTAKAEDVASRKKRRRAKAIQLLALVGLFGLLAVHLEPDMQEQARDFLSGLGIVT